MLLAWMKLHYQNVIGNIVVLIHYACSRNIYFNQFSNNIQVAGNIFVSQKILKRNFGTRHHIFRYNFILSIIQVSAIIFPAGNQADKTDKYFRLVTLMRYFDAINNTIYERKINPISQ